MHSSHYNFRSGTDVQQTLVFGIVSASFIFYSCVFNADFASPYCGCLYSFFIVINIVLLQFILQRIAPVGRIHVYVFPNNQSINVCVSTDDTLEMRQGRAKELRQSTIRAPTMNDAELADLRADIKVAHR